jgi:hypothetical protein
MSSSNITPLSDSRELILRSKTNPLTLLEDTYGVNSIISAFLKSVLGSSFSENPLPTNAVHVSINSMGTIQYGLTVKYADKLWEKVGTIIAILSSVILEGGGSYPNAVSLHQKDLGDTVLRNLSDVRSISLENFTENPFHSIEVNSIQALEEFLGKVNFILTQYCRWIYVRTRALIRDGRDPVTEATKILILPCEGSRFCHLHCNLLTIMFLHIQLSRALLILMTQRMQTLTTLSRLGGLCDVTYNCKFVKPRDHCGSIPNNSDSNFRDSSMTQQIDLSTLFSHVPRKFYLVPSHSRYLKDT